MLQRRLEYWPWLTHPCFPISHRDKEKWGVFEVDCCTTDMHFFKRSRRIISGVQWHCGDWMLWEASVTAVAELVVTPCCGLVHRQDDKVLKAAILVARYVVHFQVSDKTVAIHLHYVGKMFKFGQSLSHTLPNITNNNGWWQLVRHCSWCIAIDLLLTNNKK